MSVFGIGSDFANTSIQASLIWRTDAGPDTTLSTTVGSPLLLDGGGNAGLILGFKQTLPAEPTQCGDELILELTLLPDGGAIYEANPRIFIP